MIQYPISRYITKGNEISITKRHVHTCVCCTLFRVAGCGINLGAHQQIKFLKRSYRHSGALFSHKE